MSAPFYNLYIDFLFEEVRRKFTFQEMNDRHMETYS